MSIDLTAAKTAFSRFLKQYKNTNDPGFQLKVVHTFHVTENAKMLAELLKLSEEDIQLAQLIALLHDIGRFEELKITSELNNLYFDHASYGVKMLFEDHMIRDYIATDCYDAIIKAAILNHNKKEIQNRLEGKELLHAQLIRDADKLDNFRVKIEEPTENLFPGRVNSVKAMEESAISSKILQDLLSEKSADIHDRITPLDYYVTILGFVFDLNFKESKKIILEKNYINLMIDRYVYKNKNTGMQMEQIRSCILHFLMQS